MWPRRSSTRWGWTRRGTTATRWTAPSASPRANRSGASTVDHSVRQVLQLAQDRLDWRFELLANPRLRQRLGGELAQLLQPRLGQGAERRTALLREVLLRFLDLVELAVDRLYR